MLTAARGVLIAISLALAFSATGKQDGKGKGKAAPAKAACAREEAACSAADDARSQAESCAEWVRRGTYKRDGSLMTSADCAEPPEDAREREAAACDKRNACQRAAQCRAALAASPAAPICAYGGKPGVWRCRSAVGGCDPVLVDGVNIHLPRGSACEAARELSADLADVVDGWKDIVADARNDGQGRGAEFGCNKAPKKCQQKLRCAQSALGLAENDLAACNCKESGGVDVLMTSPDGSGHAPNLCGRDTALPSDASDRATAMAVGGLLSAQGGPSCVPLDPSSMDSPIVPPTREKAVPR